MRAFYILFVYLSFFLFIFNLFQQNFGMAVFALLALILNKIAAERHDNEETK
jgi:hypothetical protein